MFRNSSFPFLKISTCRAGEMTAWVAGHSVHALSSEPQHPQKISGIALLVIQRGRGWLGSFRKGKGRQIVGAFWSASLDGNIARSRFSETPSQGNEAENHRGHVMSFWPLCMCMHGACVHITPVCANTHTPQIHTFIKQIKNKQATK